VFTKFFWSLNAAESNQAHTAQRKVASAKLNKV